MCGVGPYIMRLTERWSDSDCCWEDCASAFPLQHRVLICSSCLSLTALKSTSGSSDCCDEKPVTGNLAGKRHKRNNISACSSGNSSNSNAWSNDSCSSINACSSGTSRVCNTDRSSSSSGCSSGSSSSTCGDGISSNNWAYNGGITCGRSNSHSSTSSSNHHHFFDSKYEASGRRDIQTAAAATPVGSCGLSRDFVARATYWGASLHLVLNGAAAAVLNGPLQSRGITLLEQLWPPDPQQQQQQLQGKTDSQWNCSAAQQSLKKHCAAGSSVAANTNVSAAPASIRECCAAGISVAAKNRTSSIRPVLAASSSTDSLAEASLVCMQRCRSTTARGCCSSETVFLLPPAAVAALWGNVRDSPRSTPSTTLKQNSSSRIITSKSDLINNSSCKSDLRINYSSKSDLGSNDSSNSDVRSNSNSNSYLRSNSNTSKPGLRSSSSKSDRKSNISSKTRLNSNNSSNGTDVFSTNTTSQANGNSSSSRQNQEEPCTITYELSQRSSRSSIKNEERCESRHLNGGSCFGLSSTEQNIFYISACCSAASVPGTFVMLASLSSLVCPRRNAAAPTVACSNLRCCCCCCCLSCRFRRGEERAPRASLSNVSPQTAQGSIAVAAIGPECAQGVTELASVTPLAAHGREATEAAVAVTQEADVEETTALARVSKEEATAEVIPDERRAPTAETVRAAGRGTTFLSEPQRSATATAPASKVSAGSKGDQSVGETLVYNPTSKSFSTAPERASNCTCGTAGHAAAAESRTLLMTEDALKGSSPSPFQTIAGFVTSRATPSENHIFSAADTAALETVTTYQENHSVGDKKYHSTGDHKHYSTGTDTASNIHGTAIQKDEKATHEASSTYVEWVQLTAAASGEHVDVDDVESKAAKDSNISNIWRHTAAFPVTRGDNIAEEKEACRVFHAPTTPPRECAVVAAEVNLQASEGVGKTVTAEGVSEVEAQAAVFRGLAPDELSSEQHTAGSFRFSDFHNVATADTVNSFAGTTTRRPHTTVNGQSKGSHEAEIAGDADQCIYMAAAKEGVIRYKKEHPMTRVDCYRSVGATATGESLRTLAHVEPVYKVERGLYLSGERENTTACGTSIYECSRARAAVREIVYVDLLSKGFLVTDGLIYGADWLLYVAEPTKSHATALVFALFLKDTAEEGEGLISLQEPPRDKNWRCKEEYQKHLAVLRDRVKTRPEEQEGTQQDTLPKCDSHCIHPVREKHTERRERYNDSLCGGLSHGIDSDSRQQRKYCCKASLVCKGVTDAVRQNSSVTGALLASGSERVATATVVRMDATATTQTPVKQGKQKRGSRSVSPEMRPKMQFVVIGRAGKACKISATKNISAALLRRIKSALSPTRLLAMQRMANAVHKRAIVAVVTFGSQKHVSHGAVASFPTVKTSEPKKHLGSSGALFDKQKASLTEGGCLIEEVKTAPTVGAVAVSHAKVGVSTGAGNDTNEEPSSKKDEGLTQDKIVTRSPGLLADTAARNTSVVYVELKRQVKDLFEFSVRHRKEAACRS